MVRNIRDRRQSRIVELRTVRSEDLASKLENLAENTIDLLLRSDMSGESPVQLATMVGISIDKARLLRGQATQIFGRDTRSKLDELLPALLVEARRRGMNMIDVTPAIEPEKVSA